MIDWKRLLFLCTGLITAVLLTHFSAQSSGFSQSFLPIVTDQQYARFAVIGDYGSGDAEETAVANMVKSWQPHFIITLGDNNYPEGTAETIEQNVGRDYGEYVFSQPTRFFPSIGNHDWDNSITPYLNYFPISQSPANTQSSGNERYYDFIQEPVHFFVLSSNPNEPDGNTRYSVQAEWLQAQLAASTMPWQIIYFHHTPFSSSDLHGASPWMQWPFADWGGDVVMASHAHIYERILRDIPYFVNGVGGKSLYELDDPVQFSEFQYNEKFGAMLVEAKVDCIYFTFYAIPNEFVDSYEMCQPSNTD